MGNGWTPGPWRVDASNKRRTRVVVDFAGIATVNHGLHTTGNANLIAAAPELYSALAKLLDATAQGIDPFEEPGHPLVDHAMRALAKARGDSESDIPKTMGGGG